jgi:hypothetical protein
MGETRDYLEEHGGPGMIECRRGGFVAGPCADCRGECAEWQPDEEAPDEAPIGACTTCAGSGGHIVLPVNPLPTERGTWVQCKDCNGTGNAPK